MTNDEDIVKEFLIESYENLDQLDQELVELENTPKEPNLLSSIFPHHSHYQGNLWVSRLLKARVDHTRRRKFAEQIA